QMAVSTAEAYRRFDALPSPPLDESPPSLGELPAVELLEQLRNDLEPPVFAGYPALGELRRSLEDRLGRPVRMSGSGSTLFTLFDSIDEAAETAGRVTNVRAAGVKLCPM